MKTTGMALLAAMLILSTATPSTSQIAYDDMYFSIDVSPGIRLVQETQLDYDPTVVGNADGFFTVDDGSVPNSTPASWAMDGSDGVTVVYQFTVPSTLVNNTDNVSTIPVTTNPELSASATCGAGDISWDPASLSAPCDLTGLTMPVSGAVTLDRVNLDLSSAVPGLYSGFIELTATIQ